MGTGERYRSVVCIAKQHKLSVQAKRTVRERKDRPWQAERDGSCGGCFPYGSDDDHVTHAERVQQAPGVTRRPHHPPLPYRPRLQVHRACQAPPPSTRPTSPSSSASQSRPTSRGSWTYSLISCSSMPLSATHAPEEAQHQDFLLVICASHEHRTARHEDFLLKNRPWARVAFFRIMMPAPSPISRQRT